jgi:hypothetical protein
MLDIVLRNGRRLRVPGAGSLRWRDGSISGVDIGEREVEFEADDVESITVTDGPTAEASHLEGRFTALRKAFVRVRAGKAAGNEIDGRIDYLKSVIHRMGGLDDRQAALRLMHSHDGELTRPDWSVPRPDVPSGPAQQPLTADKPEAEPRAVKDQSLEALIDLLNPNRE